MPQVRKSAANDTRKFGHKPSHRISLPKCGPRKQRSFDSGAEVFCTDRGEAFVTHSILFQRWRKQSVTDQVTGFWAPKMHVKSCLRVGAVCFDVQLWNCALQLCLKPHFEVARLGGSPPKSRESIANEIVKIGHKLDTEFPCLSAGPVSKGSAQCDV